jgi:hypothetical protein
MFGHSVAGAVMYNRNKVESQCHCIRIQSCEFEYLQRLIAWRDSVLIQYNTFTHQPIALFFLQINPYHQITSLNL